MHPLTDARWQDFEEEYHKDHVLGKRTKSRPAHDLNGGVDQRKGTVAALGPVNETRAMLNLAIGSQTCCWFRASRLVISDADPLYTFSDLNHGPCLEKCAICYIKHCWGCPNDLSLCAGLKASRPPLVPMIHWPCRMGPGSESAHHKQALVLWGRTNCGHSEDTRHTVTACQHMTKPLQVCPGGCCLRCLARGQGFVMCWHAVRPELF